MNQNKMVMYQVKYSRGVMYVGRVNAQRIAQELQARFGRGVIDASSIEGQLLGYCDLLGAITEEFETASRKVSREVTEDFLARGRRDEGLERIRKLLSTGRTRVRDNLGEDALRIFKLDQRTPQGQEAVGNYAAEVLYLLQQHPRTATDVLGGPFNTDDLAAALRPAIADYQSSLDDVVREERETQQTRQVRNEIEERFRDVLFNVAAILEAHLRMVGLDELADRIRPTYARTTGEVEVDLPDSPEPDTPEPDHAQSA